MYPSPDQEGGVPSAYPIHLCSCSHCHIPESRAWFNHLGGLHAGALAHVLYSSAVGDCAYCCYHGGGQ